MSRSPSHDHPLDLESHGHFVRRLAAEILGFHGDSEDLAQEALLAAVRSHAVETVPRPALRSWFAKTLRRMASARRRQAAGRAYREAAYAQELGDEPSPDEHCVQSETVRRVSDAVLALDEPYLSTVLLAYYEDQSPREIAAAQGVPLATVRSRLQRAREQLRARLQAEYGGSDRALGLALAPLVPESLRAARSLVGAGPVASIPLTLGAIGMKVKLTVALAALGGLVWLGMQADALLPRAQGDAEPEAQGVEQLAANVPGERVQPATQPQPAPPQAMRTTLGAEPEDQQDGPPIVPMTGLFGRVHYEGEPVADVEVVLAKPGMALIKDPQGHRRPAPPRSEVVEAIFSDQLGHPTYRPTPLDFPVDGEPPGELLLVNERADALVTSTDAEGRFRFPDLPDKPFLLVFKQPERGLALRDIPRIPVAGLGREPAMNLGTLELQRAATILGRIQAANALQLHGHEASLSDWRRFKTETDPDGSFRLTNIPPGDYLLGLWPRTGLLLTERNKRYVRLQPGETRQATLDLTSIPCSIASVSVTCNGAPFSDQTVAFTAPHLEQSVRLYLDENGRGVATLPARTAIRCTAWAGKNQLSVGPDLVLEEGAVEVALQLDAGSVELRIPTSEFPAPDVAELAFEIDSPDYTAVRFDQFNAGKGPVIQLDPAGRATVTVPAWTRLEPVLRYQDRVWVYVETDRAEFPAGSSAFHIHVDEASGGMRLTGGRDATDTAKGPYPKRYRVALGWSSPTNGEPQALYADLDPLRFPGSSEPYQVFRFELVPPEIRTFTVSLQRKGGSGGKTYRSWPLELDVVAGETTVRTLDGPTEGGPDGR